MSDESGGQCAAVVVVAAAVIVLVLAGAHGEKLQWERMLVDEPEVVAAIRSRVLAERAEKAIK